MVNESTSRVACIECYYHVFDEPLSSPHRHIWHSQQCTHQNVARHHYNSLTGQYDAEVVRCREVNVDGRCQLFQLMTPQQKRDKDVAEQLRAEEAIEKEAAARAEKRRELATSIVTALQELGLVVRP